MAPTNFSTVTSPAGIWSHSLKTQHCESCGREIPAHEHYLRFPYFEGREHAVACVICALGPETSGPSLPAVAILGEVA